MSLEKFLLLCANLELLLRFTDDGWIEIKYKDTSHDK